jgi:hypothetical protein
MQISHKTRKKPGHFCGMPHSTPRRTIPHHAARRRICAARRRICAAAVVCRFRTKQLRQATLLHKTIHLSAATVDSVWHLCSKVLKFIDIIPHLKRGLPMELCGNSMGKAEAV